MKLKKELRRRVHLAKTARVAAHLENSYKKQNASWNVINAVTPDKVTKQFREVVVEDEMGNLHRDPIFVADTFNNFLAEVHKECKIRKSLLTIYRHKLRL